MRCRAHRRAGLDAGRDPVATEHGERSGDHARAERRGGELAQTGSCLARTAGKLRALIHEQQTVTDSDLGLYSNVDEP